MASAARSYFKKGMKAPDRAVVLSLVAVLIVCAAPCFVSYMDAQVTEGVYSEVEMPSDLTMYQYRAVGNNSNITDVSGVTFTEIDGTTYFRNDSSDPILVFYMKYLTLDEETGNIASNDLVEAIKNGATHVEITFDEDSAEFIDNVGLKWATAGGAGLYMDKSEDGLTYSIDLDTLDRLNYSNGAFLMVNFVSGGLPQNGTVSFTCLVAEPATDFSGSAVVGFFGIVLIVLALCCTNLINPLRRM